MIATIKSGIGYHTRVMYVFLLAVMIWHPAGISALDADIDVTRYRTPDKAYIEFFLYVLGSSLTSVPADSGRQASVNVTYYIQSDTQLILGDRYNLVSFGDSLVPDFMDLHRHFLDPGVYEIIVELSDNHDSLNTVTLSQNFTIHAVSPALAQSDIRLLGHIEATTVETVWVRNGQRMTPLPYDWYRDDLTFLYFYNELYHSDVGLAADFYISYAIVPARDPEHILLQGFKRLKPKPVNFIVQAMDISGLTSGEYILRVGVYDKARTLRSETETIFIRSNPEADRKIAASADRYFDMSFTLRMPEDSVRYALRALAPVISQIQVPVLNYLLKEGELENQRRFLHQYFVETDLHDPEGAYIAYMELVAIVDKEYHSAFGYGFETDRGRILLKYGMPDDIIAVDDEPSAPPYEIWFYHAFPVTSQSDVRFLFYNPSLAGGDYQLLHSTAIGELQNNRWQQELYRDALSEPGAGDFIDARDVQPNWNRRAVEYFRD